MVINKSLQFSFADYIKFIVRRYMTKFISLLFPVFRSLGIIGLLCQNIHSAVDWNLVNAFGWVD
jgi:hypothetical protein